MIRSPFARAARNGLSELASLARRVLPRTPGAIRIVYYHRIDEEDHRSCVTPTAFAAQMEWLAGSGHRFLSLAEVREHLAQRRPFPEKSVVITLDDGFRDNYTNAFPVLRQQGIPATIFLTAGFIGTPELPVLRDRSGIPPLDWAQVREMAAAGIDFGAHTMTHPSLTTLDEATLESEIVESRDRIAEELGASPPTFCYPRGHCDDRVKAAVAAAGFEIACTTAPGEVMPDEDPFSLRRTFIARDDTLRDFQKKLDGSFDLLHSARQRLSSRPPTQAVAN